MSMILVLFIVDIFYCVSSMRRKTNWSKANPRVYKIRIGFDAALIFLFLVGMLREAIL